MDALHKPNSHKLDSLGQTKLAVAYSGGADSTALLHQTVAKHPQNTVAFHIHHGLQAGADDFAMHCQHTCDALKVPLFIQRVNAKAEEGQSPEDAARTARYKALANLAIAQNVSAVLLAQHGDDQIETLLLALSRGAGLGGMSGMAKQFTRHGVNFERPMLGLSAGQIRTWLTEQNIPFIEDPTNADQRYTRNKIATRCFQFCMRRFRKRAQPLPAVRHTSRKLMVCCKSLQRKIL